MAAHKILVALILFCSLAESQTFYGAGVSGFADTSPKPSGWAIVATQLSKSQDVWSFSETEAFVVDRKVVTSARTGLATGIRSFGKWKLYGLAMAGVATNGVSTAGAYSGGGLLVGPLRKRLMSMVGIRVIRSAVGGTQSTVSVGIGW